MTVIGSVSLGDSVSSPSSPLNQLSPCLGELLSEWAGTEVLFSSTLSKFVPLEYAMVCRSHGLVLDMRTFCEEMY